MCTLTWTPHEGGFAVLFNRDELLTRQPGLPPMVIDHGGTRILCPRDGDHGGTWIGVNEHGVVVAALNGDPHAPRGAGPFRSRGLVVMDALRARSAEAAIGFCEALDPASVQPFTLFAIDGDMQPIAFEHNLHHRARKAVDSPSLLASSSLVHEDAKAARARHLLDRFAAPSSSRFELLAAFHQSHDPARGPLSPCMHRDDARTVSASRVFVAHGIARIEHHQGPPCELRQWTSASLRLAASRA